MSFTHEEMLNAVRRAGRDGQSFTCATVRECLGVSGSDRETLNRFQRRFRSFREAAGEELEKVGQNAYRLKAEAVSASCAAPRAAAEPVSSEAVRPTEAVSQNTEFSRPPTATAQQPEQARAAMADVPPAWHIAGTAAGRWLGRRVAELFGRNASSAEPG